VAQNADNAQPLMGEALEVRYRSAGAFLRNAEIC